MFKSLVLLIFICLVAFCASAQTNTGFNYNIGLSAFSFSQAPQVNFSQRSITEVRRYFPGIILKISDNQLAYRIGIDYHRNRNFNLNQDDSVSVHGAYTNYAFKLGFERDLSMTAFKPYYGVDAGFVHTDFLGSRARIPSASSMLKTEKNGLLLSPFVGIKYTIVPRLYISVEAAISFIYAYNRVETVTDNINYVSHFNKGEFLLSPVSLVGLHYNFGSAN